ncbi:MAG TPA: NUDIX domain-containing protein [Candidatus Limnocylindrales bacterium]|nr:NUDIX domain-containing protein [Candidatus Limnocylindrales bacterium]
MTTGAIGPSDGVVRVGAYALVLDDGRLLLCRNADPGPDHGAWTLPGGGLEFGEEPAEAALRELTEETGLIGEIESLADVSSRFVARSVAFAGRPLHTIFVVYRVRIVGGSLRPEMGGSTDACAFFGVDEMAELPLMALGRAGVALALPARSDPE